MKTEEGLVSTAHARKMLLDYLDSKRPWAHCKDVYVMMEDIADYASYAFRGELIPTQKDVRELHARLLQFTEPLTVHPEGFEGPCACEECRRDNAD